ncbi:copper-binding protein [Oceanobacillus arenosus]|uniref:Copper chaperone CopZ n=1 Tax=Oceanobacillus arenosus TaxID=1229153 RepID=A0A3D8PQ32_9BACI|nr:copper chaperone CopZ [Oceanobacillus arenosus]RDW18256.1 copper-binding protein [Oceanobacillus arenosus]
MEKTLNVQGMSCNHCKMSVEGALQKLAGVSAAEVNLEAGSVAVTFDDSKVNVDTMKEVIEEQGYDVEAKI